jgi:hypothetical protein
MKTHPISKLTVAAGLAAVLALAAMVTAQPGPPAGKGPMGPMSGPMMMHGRQEMMDHMKATDDKLLEQVSNLTGASTEAKVDLLADIVTTLVKERADMHQQMRMMDPPMSPDQIMNAERMQSIAGMPCVEAKQGEAASK